MFTFHPLLREGGQEEGAEKGIYGLEITCKSFYIAVSSSMSDILVLILDLSSFFFFFKFSY